MAYTDINSEDRLVQATFADHLESALGWDSVYAWNDETFGPEGTLGRADTRDVVLTRDLRAALMRLNPDLPIEALEEAVGKLTRHDFTRSLLQHNQEFYKLIRDGVPVNYRDAKGDLRYAQARVIDFQDVSENRFLAVRELKITGLRTPSYNRRADLVCFVNGLPLVFIELKAVYKNIRAGFDNNLAGLHGRERHRARVSSQRLSDRQQRRIARRYGSITSQWDHFYGVEARTMRNTRAASRPKVLLDGMLASRIGCWTSSRISSCSTAASRAAARKVVARNHQVLGVNNAVASVRTAGRVEAGVSAGERLRYRTVELPGRSG